jgi:proton-dependent oligopeptide transporter, POT family
MQSTGERTFLGHPIGLTTLATTELWERFSFYGMRAILVLYLIAPTTQTGAPGPGLGFAAGSAAAIYGSYNALVYLTPLAGGWIADRIIGARRSVLIGGIIIAGGHYLMAIPAQAMFWIGLLFIAGGTGLLKPNISSMVGDLYEGQPQSRRDSAFSIFYMGINIGAFTAPLVVGSLAQSFGWHWGFIAAGIGMTLAVIIYVLGGKSLHGAGKEPATPATRPEINRSLTITAIGFLIFLIALWIQGLFTDYSVNDVASVLAVTVVVIAILFFIKLFRTKGLTKTDKGKLRAFLALFIGAAMFWMIFDQAGSTLNIFAEQWTDRNVGSWVIPASWMQSINPLFIIAFSPVFAWLWIKLANRAPSTPLKFAIALIGIGLSFWIMILPGIAASEGKQSAMWWLISVYLLQTWAELLLSPTGLSASTTLAPVGMGSQILALWFLAVSVGDAVGGQLVEVFLGMGYGSFFAWLGAMAIALGIGYLFAVKWINRQMQE